MDAPKGFMPGAVLASVLSQPGSCSTSIQSQALDQFIFHTIWRELVSFPICKDPRSAVSRARHLVLVCSLRVEE